MPNVAGGLVGLGLGLALVGFVGSIVALATAADGDRGGRWLFLTVPVLLVGCTLLGLYGR